MAQAWQARNQPVESRKGEYQRKTYLVEPETVQRIAQLAEREDIPLNDLVRFLLGYALDEIESGRVPLPVRIVEQRRL